MLKLFDTSVIVAALSESHAMHERARPHLEDALSEKVTMAVGAHALAEVYSTLTALNVQPRITPRQAQQLIEENVTVAAHVVTLTGRDYAAALERMAPLGLLSGAIYDCLHVIAAEKADADELLTLNGRDFRRMPLGGDTKLVVL